MGKDTVSKVGAVVVAASCISTTSQIAVAIPMGRVRVVESPADAVTLPVGANPSLLYRGTAMAHESGPGK